MDEERASLRTRLRFSPHVLIVVLAAWPGFYCLREAIGAGIYARYAATYRQVDFVMEEARPNGDAPYAAGHLEPGGLPINAPLAGAAPDWVLAEDPATRFAVGGHVPMWWSPQAPIVGYGRQRYTNGALVARLPTLPGWGVTLGWLAGFLASFWCGFAIAARMAPSRELSTEQTLG